MHIHTKYIYILFRCSVVHCLGKCDALCCGALQCVAVCCCLVQCGAVYCSVLQVVVLCSKRGEHISKYIYICIYIYIFIYIHKCTHTRICMKTYIARKGGPRKVQKSNVELSNTCSLILYIYIYT